MASVIRGAVLRQIEQLYREGTFAGLGDAALLERYRVDRDEAAFEGLVNRHGPMVLGLCRRMLREPEDVHDAFQATFLILVRRAAAIRDGDLLSNWLYGVAYRVAIRARANRARRRGRETAIANLEAAVFPESTELRELKPLIDRELNRLPLKYRAPMILCHLNESHARTGGRGDRLSGRHGAQPPGSRSRLAQKAVDAPGLCSRGGGAQTGCRASRSPSHRVGTAGTRVGDRQSGAGAGVVADDSRRRGHRVGAGPYPRSTHDHEACPIQMARIDDSGDDGVGRRRDRRVARGGAQRRSDACAQGGGAEQYTVRSPGAPGSEGQAG